MDEDKAIDRILASIKLINGRKYLSNREQQAVRKAIFLAHQPAQLFKTATERRRENYRIFLNEFSGNPLLIAICAVTFGQTTIGDMRDELRINLPSRIMERQHDFHCDALADCGNKCKAEAKLISSAGNERSRLSLVQEPESTPPTGQALPLDRLDVINLLTSQHFKGAFMHEPFDTELSPVVQLTVSHEWSHWLRNKTKPRSS